MIRRPPRSTLDRSSAASDVYKRQAEHLLFIQQQNLFAQRMEWKSLRRTGEPLLVVRNVAASPAYLGSSEFAASQNGVLIYGTAERSSIDTLRWYLRDGSTVGTVEPIVDYQQ